MRYLALTVAIDGKIPEYNKGLMHEVVEIFTSRGYHIEKLDDKTTRPRGFYLFETNSENFIPVDDFYIALHDFKNKNREKNIRFRLRELDDAYEIGFLKPST